VAAAAIAPPHRALVILGILVWFGAPGVWLTRRLYGRWAPALLTGPAVGYAFSLLALLALWGFGGRGQWVLAAAPVLSFVFMAAAAALGPALHGPDINRRDLVPVLLLLLTVPLIVGRPFSRVAEMMPDGRAYRAYFTADFVWAMAVANEVSKGDVPPQNPFFSGDALRYYWPSHLLASVEYRQYRRSMTVEQVLLLNSIGVSLLFVAFLYGLVRQFVASRGAALVGCAMALLFAGFEGLERLIFLWQSDLPLRLLRETNIDAVTRWYYAAMPVDGLHRMFLYQSHHLMGYTASLAALLFVTQAKDVTKPGIALLTGSLLAASLLISSFIALMVGLAVALLYAWRLYVARAWTAILICALGGVVPVALAVVVSEVFQYVDHSGGSLVAVGLNRTATRHWPLALTLSFGPLLAGSIAGLWLAARSRALRLLPVALVVAVSLAFYFLVDVPDHQGVWVGWRAGHMLLIASGVLTAFVLQDVWKRGPAVRRIACAVTALLVLASAPTLAIDVFNAQDVDIRVSGPGFDWALVLSPEELEALNWIQRYTPLEAIVQPDPVVRDVATWAYIPAFARRRMAAGVPISMAPLGKYRRASARIHETIFQAPSNEAAHAAARREGIQYLVIGPPERTDNPGIEAMLDADPTRFSAVFRNSRMTIYAVNRS
jgi:hypothetical protein